MIKLLKYGSILFSLGVFFSKAKSVYDQFDLEFSINKLRIKEVNFPGLLISFSADIEISNNNGIPVYFPISLKRIDMFINQIPIGTAYVDRKNLFIGINDKIVLNDIQLDFNFSKYEDIYDVVKNLKNASINYTVHYEISGKEYIYNNTYLKL